MIDAYEESTESQIANIYIGLDRHTYELEDMVNAYVSETGVGVAEFSGSRS